MRGKGRTAAYLAAISVILITEMAASSPRSSGARLLMLNGQAAATNAADCVARPGQRGTWHRGATNNWIKCPKKPADPNVPKQTNFLPFVGAGALVAGGVGAGVAGAGNGNPVSP